MVLAKAKRHTYKLKSYKESLQHLSMTIEELMNVYHDEDKLHDLKVLYDDTAVLIKAENAML
jgi:hypothetical protein